MALAALLPQPDDGVVDVLIVGLAGGTVSNLMNEHVAGALPGLRIVGIEIDPVVIEAADEHLGLDHRNLEVEVADGRLWLAATSRRFDLVLLDAYQQPSIPAHLATVEFFESVREHLSPGGVAALNVFAPAGASRLLSGLAATWQAVFPESEIYTGPARDGFSSRLMFGGGGLPLDFGRVAPRSIGAPLRSAWASLRAGTRRASAPPAVAPWTDDRSPVELLTDQLYRAARPASVDRAR